MFIVQTTIPKWLIPIVKKFSKTFHIIPEYMEQKISNYIEAEEYKKARDLIYITELQYGTSVFTVMLTTRIDRIQILSEE